MVLAAYKQVGNDLDLFALSFGMSQRGRCQHIHDICFMLDYSIATARSRKVFLRFLTRRFLILLIVSLYREGF